MQITNQHSNFFVVVFGEGRRGQAKVNALMPSIFDKVFIKGEL
jgi:hypothetical protein